MNPLNLNDLNQYVNENIDDFHKRRIEILCELKLKKLLNKNPYLIRAKNITTASELINSTMSAFLSSSEEKLFGDFLEGLAIFVAGNTTGGHKSSSQGIDLEFVNRETYYIVSVKSGENWGNSSQHKKLSQDFRDAGIRLRQARHIRNVQPVLGICYGKAKTCDHKDGYLKVVGQNFWTLISENKNLYTEIIEPIGYRAKEHNDNYLNKQAQVINRLTKEFIDQYCDQNGMINWPLVVQANSGNYDLDQFLEGNS